MSGLQSSNVARQPRCGAAARLLATIVLLLLVFGCSKRDDQLTEARRLLDEGSPVAARQLILEQKLDLTAEGAQMLIAAYMHNEEYAAALNKVTEQPQRFTETTRTDVCTLAAFDAVENDEFSLAKSRLETCDELVDAERIDLRAVDFVATNAETDGDHWVQWSGLADSLADTEGSPELDTAADALILFAQHHVERAEEAEKGELLVAYIKELDAIPLRLELLDWQLRQIPELDADVAISCLATIERESSGLLEEYPELSAAFQELRDSYKRTVDAGSSSESDDEQPAEGDQEEEQASDTESQVSTDDDGADGASPEEAVESAPECTIATLAADEDSRPVEQE
jgi:hypothetical protein